MQVMNAWKKDLAGCYESTQKLIEENANNDDEFSLGMLENLKRQQLVSLEK